MIGNMPADHERKNGDGFGRARDGLAPAGLGQAKNCGDQRAGVGDADPKNKVDEIEAPKYGATNSRDTDARVKLVAPGAETPNDDCGQH